MVLTVTEMLRAHGVVGSSSSSTATAWPNSPGRPRHHRQHGPRVRRNHGLLPHRRETPSLPAPHRPQSDEQVDWSRPTPRSKGLFRTDRRLARADNSPKRSSLDLSTVQPSARRAKASAGPHRRSRHAGVQAASGNARSVRKAWGLKRGSSRRRNEGRARTKRATAVQRSTKCALNGTAPSSSPPSLVARTLQQPRCHDRCRAWSHARRASGGSTASPG